MGIDKIAPDNGLTDGAKLGEQRPIFSPTPVWGSGQRKNLKIDAKPSRPMSLSLSLSTYNKNPKSPKT